MNPAQRIFDDLDAKSRREALSEADSLLLEQCMIYLKMMPKTRGRRK